MKRLACLCVLFFAGHVMAQTTCSNATAKGICIGANEPGELAAAVHGYDVGLATINGDGTGTLEFSHTETGGAANGTNLTASITYTVNSDCSATGKGMGTLPGVPLPYTVSFSGYISPSGDNFVFVTQELGIALNAVLTRQ